jgi:hypothetical protein
MNTRHLLIMLACCLIPITLLVAIGVLGIPFSSLSPLLPYALVLLCQLMMVFMIRGMSHDHSAADTQKHDPAHLEGVKTK